MKKLSMNVGAARIDELSALLNENRGQLLALQKEVGELKKVNAGLGNRLDMIRRWALRNIHLRNEMMKGNSSSELTTPRAGVGHHQSVMP